ncbi:hypothetical protein [Deinococcus gobiensis]|uniref:Uncharacterized protein n=1 Tax=Deinococcus gobiensis (strain DSM 21396 / JCM 16679 / CGMCC 1.7299 / I-0) TaxID=745776 RepID=H8H1Q4_DEIGI|nr:hypothetical protein [Deinococcus gobiensis]AFD27451.1 hypothetical protein DGo_PB0182 [Deinococcus gobiensis I-0]
MKKTLLTALLALTLTATAHAQSAATTATAVVTVPGAQPMAMPLNVYLLPYGTIKISEGNYFISNYEGTGISVYLQSPTPLRIATLEEMVRYQAEWARLTSTTASAPMPVVSTPKATAAVTAPTAQPVAAVAPAAAQSLSMLTMPSGQPLSAASVTQPAAPMSMMAPLAATPMTMPTAQTTMPVQSTQPIQTAQPVQQQVAWTQPAPMVAAPASVPQTAMAPTWPQTQAAPAVNTMAFPQAAQAFAAPQAFPTAQTGMMPAVAATMAPTPIPTAQLQSAAPTNTYSPATTLVPNYLRLSFRGRGTTLTYSIGNNSSEATVRLDPQSVRIYQDGQIVPANLSVRDSTGDTTSGALSPRAMLVGTVSVVTRSTSPITLMWQATDAQGRTYPISYAWLPQ